MAVGGITSESSMRALLQRELHAIENDRPLIKVSELGQLPACVGRVELLLLAQTHGTMKRAELGALSDSLLLGLLQDEQRDTFAKEQELNKNLRDKVRETGQLSNALAFTNGLTIAFSITAGVLAGGPAGMVAVAAGLFNAGRLVAENTSVYRKAAQSLYNDPKAQREMEQTLMTGSKWLGIGISVGTAFCGGWDGLKEASSSLFQQTTRYRLVLQGYLGFRQARVSAGQSQLMADRVDLRGDHTRRELEVDEAYSSLSDHLTKERTTFEMLSQVREALQGLDYQIMQGV